MTDTTDKAPEHGQEPASPAPPPLAPKQACGAPTRRGGPCPAPPMNGKDHCRMHSNDPEVQAALAVARSHGGNSTNVVAARIGLNLADLDVESPAGLRRAIKSVVTAVAEGRIPSSAGQTIASLLGLALKLGELEVRAQLDKLEAELVAQQQERGTRRR